MSQQQSIVEFREIKGYPAYRASSDGHVWSNLSGSWQKLKPGWTLNGRLFVYLYPGRKKFQLHRLILEAFVGPCPKGMECRHFPDKNPHNNAVSNLQWGTKKQNQQDRVFHGTSSRGEQNGFARLTAEIIASIRADASAGMSLRLLAKKYGVCKTSAANIVSRKSWKHI